MRATASPTVLECEDLARRFDVVWSTVRAEQTSTGAPRQRQPGGGRQGCLINAELKLFFILL